jgi:CRP-like cAMP-binding protein
MSELETTAKFLAKVPLFSSLKARQVKQLAGRMVARDYDTGEDIVEQGKGGIGLFIIVSGAADVIRVNSDGSKAVVNEFGPTDFFGELSLLDEEPRTASVIATEKTECLVLSQWEFLGALRQDAEMSIVILQELAKRFRRALNTL